MNKATKHNNDCGRVFAKYDAACPRCQELASGQAPRAGWQKGYYARKAYEASLARQRHDCKLRGCLPICTFGDW